MRYKIDVEGNRMEVPDIAVALWPEQTKHAWFCSQCSIYMKLYPISHDLPPTHYFCRNCKKNITMAERDAAFEACIKLAKEQLDLKTLEYNKEDRTWKIESSIFIGDSRIGAKRKPIKQIDREEIIDKIQETIADTLHISFENFQEFFNEG